MSSPRQAVRLGSETISTDSQVQIGQGMFFSTNEPGEAITSAGAWWDQDAISWRAVETGSTIVALGNDNVIRLYVDSGLTPGATFNPTVIAAFSMANDGTGAMFLGAPVGIPRSKLDVNGGVAIGSYAGSTAAPDNGLIVSGNVGLGVPDPANGLVMMHSRNIAWKSAGGGSELVGMGSDSSDNLLLFTDGVTRLKILAGGGIQDPSITTVGALPTAITALEGARRCVSDLTGPSYMALAVGGGSVRGQVYCDGAKWITA